MALALHHPNPRKMLEEMDQDILFYWITFLSRKKRAHDKKDYQLAYLTKVVAELMSSGSGKPLDTYLIKFQTKEEQLEEQLERNEKFFMSLPTGNGAVVEETEWSGE